MYKNYIKRMLDIVIAIFGLILMLPVLLIVSIAIKIDTKGPVIFKQIRTGYKGKKFKIYKFRTMRVETHDKTGREYTHAERCTKVGNVIRKLSIDELPQLINIIKGDMSIIGPRPWIQEYYKFFSKEQKKRCNVLPGITGFAQVKGRNNIDIFQKIKYDIEYTEKISLKLDIYILRETIKMVINRTGVEITQEAINEEINLLKVQ